MYEKKIICLAVSRKPPSGRCVAGRELSDEEVRGWIRPVSARPTKEVSEEERRYENGTKAQILDIIDVPLLRAERAGHQTENHVLAEDYYWVRSGRATWDQVRACIDGYDPNFWTAGESTYHGANDKVAEALAARITTSLKLVVVPSLNLRVRREDGYGGGPSRRRVRGAFQYHGTHYVMSVTDPEIEEQYLLRGDGNYEIRDAALCISLERVSRRVTPSA